MIEMLSASISNLGAILSSSFVREPRTAAFDGAAGGGEGPDAMKRFVQGKHVLCLRETFGRRTAAGRRRVAIIGGEACRVGLGGWCWCRRAPGKTRAGVESTAATHDAAQPRNRNHANTPTPPAAADSPPHNAQKTCRLHREPYGICGGSVLSSISGK